MAELQAQQVLIRIVGLVRHEKPCGALPHPDLPAQDVNNFAAFPRYIKAAIRKFVLANAVDSDPKNFGGMKIPPNIPHSTKCRNCTQTTLTILEYMTLPEEKRYPRHLRCNECGQRIPVGDDIRELPGRLAQPPVPANIAPEGDRSKVEKQCRHADCFLAGTPHPQGLFSSAKIRPPPGIPLTRVSRLDPYIPLEDMKNFWGGNDFVPRSIKEHYDGVRKEEYSYTDRKNFKITSPQLRKDLEQYRKDINKFRRYHCFFTEKGKDLLPEPEPGSREWILRYVDALPTVAVDELAEDDRTCPICRGQYGENTSIDDDKAEVPVRLACGNSQTSASGQQTLGHVFGDACLKVLLSSKEDGGWGYEHCIMCRAKLFSE